MSALDASEQPGPPIMIGYDWTLVLHLDASLLAGVPIVLGEMRARASDREPLARFLSADGTITFDTTDDLAVAEMRIHLSAASSARLRPGTVIIDFKRTDLGEPALLGFELTVPVMQPVTRGAGATP